MWFLVIVKYIDYGTNHKEDDEDVGCGYNEDIRSRLRGDIRGLHLQTPQNIISQKHKDIITEGNSCSDRLNNPSLKPFLYIRGAKNE